MNRKTSPYKAVNPRQPVSIEFRSCGWFLYDWRVSASLEIRFWWSVYFWQTNSCWKFLCSWAPLSPGQCLCCLRAAYSNCCLSLIETHFFPRCTFPRIHRNTQSQRWVPVCRLGRSCPVYSAATRMGSEGCTQWCGHTVWQYELHFLRKTDYKAWDCMKQNPSLHSYGSAKKL